jgi:vacuolar protein 8
VERGNFPRTTQNKCVTALLMLSFLVCSDLYIRRITDRQAAVLCSTEDRARAYTMHNALLSRAIKASPRLGDEIARHLFQPDPDRRFTAHLLLVTLNERYPEERNDPVLPAEVENRPGEIAHDDPPGHVGGDEEGAGEHDPVRIEAAEQNQGEGVAAAARLADPPRQKILDHDPLQEFEVELAMPENVPQGVVHHLPEIVPPAPDDAGGMPLVDEPRAGPAANLGHGVELPPGEEVPNQAHERADLGGVAVADEPVPAAEPPPGEGAPAQVPRVLERRDPAQAAEEHGAVHFPKTWGLRHVVVPLAVVAAAVCLALIPGVQQRAASLLAPLRLRLEDFAQVPPWPQHNRAAQEDLGLPPQVPLVGGGQESRASAWEPRSWVSCAAFDVEICSAVKLLHWLASSTSADKLLAAEVLSACISSTLRKHAEGESAIPHLVKILVDGPDDMKVAVTQALWRLAEYAVENREEITAEHIIPHLVQLLKEEGSAHLKESVAGVLWRLTEYTAENRKTITAEGVIPHLVQLLKEGGHTHLKENVAGVLWMLAEHTTDNRKVITAEGVIPHLVQLLKEGGHTHLKENVAGVLWMLAEHTIDNRKVITAENVIPHLVQLLKEEGSAQLKENVAGLLWRLAEHSGENRNAIAGAGVIPDLVLGLKDGCDATDVVTAGLLAELARDPQERMNIAAAGAIPLLVQLLKQCSSSATRHQLVLALWRLATDNTEYQKTIAAAEAIPHIVPILMDDGDAIKEVAAGLLAELTRGSEERKSVAAAGAIPLLVQLLKQLPRGGARYQIELALWRVATDNTENQKAIAAAGAIPHIVPFLRDGAFATKEVTAGLLAELARGPEERNSIASSGAIPLLVQLLKQLPSGSARFQIVAALWRLATDNTNNQKAIAREDAISHIVPILKDEWDATKEVVAGLLAELTNGSEERRSIAAAGAIPLLAQVLELLVGQRAGSHAVTALWRLSSDNTENRKAIAASGAIPYIVRTLMDGAASTKGWITAVLLADLARGPEERKMIAAAGAIPQLVQLLKQLPSKTKFVRSLAVAVLWRLAIDSPENQKAIAAEGAVPVLEEMQAAKFAKKDDPLARLLQMLLQPSNRQ